MNRFDAIKRQVIEKKLLHWTRIAAVVGIVGVGAAVWQLYHKPTMGDKSVENSSAEDEKLSPLLEVLDVSLSKTSLSIPASLEIELRNRSNKRAVEGPILDIDLGRNRVETCDWSAKSRGEWEETGSENRVRIRLMILEPRESFSIRCLISDTGFEKILLGGGNARNMTDTLSVMAHGRFAEKITTLASGRRRGEIVHRSHVRTHAQPRADSGSSSARVPKFGPVGIFSCDSVAHRGAPVEVDTFPVSLRRCKGHRPPPRATSAAVENHRTPFPVFTGF